MTLVAIVWGCSVVALVPDGFCIEWFCLVVCAMAVCAVDVCAINPAIPAWRLHSAVGILSEVEFLCCVSVVVAPVTVYCV